MYIIDRFEGEYVILEDERKKMVRVKKAELPAHVKTGDCIEKTGTSYRVNEYATKERWTRIQHMMDELFED